MRTLAPIGAADPLSAVVRLRRADLVDRLGNSAQAARELEQIARDYPDSPLPLSQLGDVLRSKNRFAEAVEAYDRAIARVSAPQRSAWRLFYARGVALERAHDWPKAQADLGARARSRARPALRPQLSRLFLGRQGREPVPGAADADPRGRSPAQ